MVLGVEVAVERPEGDVGPVGDVLDLDAVVVGRDHQGLGRVDDALPAFPLVRSERRDLGERPDRRIGGSRGVLRHRSGSTPSVLAVGRREHGGRVALGGVRADRTVTDLGPR